MQTVQLQPSRTTDAASPPSPRWSLFSYSTPTPTYRPDIDGLRALAVAAVVWFHAFPQQLPGGFVGVDIFFVISGFLISTILFREMATGTYRYSRFMARRIRRIFPALCIVLSVSFGLGWFLLNDKEFVALGQQIATGSAFTANILFWLEDGYFDTASEFKPLLHLWSLGIEEQFYIFYPPLLWLIYRFRGRLPLALSTVFVVSFIWNVRATVRAPAFAFFMLPPRFWELLCGGLTAWWVANRSHSAASPQFRPWIHHAASLAGCSLMIAAIMLTPEKPFPGYWALLPTLGGCLFILAGPQACLNRFVFSFRPLVALGLISYPFYLWHWPLISFEYILSGSQPESLYVVLAVLFAFVLSIFTYLLVEKPLRHLSLAKTYQWLFPGAFVTAALGWLVLWQQGFPERIAASKLAINEGEIDHETFHEYGNQKFLSCEAPELKNNAINYEGTLRCHQSRPGTEYDIILLGDSHAEHLFYGLATLLPEKNIVYAINFGLPVAGNPQLQSIYSFLTQRTLSKPSHIILGGAWALHPDDRNMTEGLINSVKLLQKTGYQVMLADGVPVFSFEPSLCKMQRRFSLRAPQCSEESPAMETYRRQIVNDLKQVALATGAKILATHDVFRDQNKFFMARNGKIFYRDNNHLNINGSLYLANQLAHSGQLASITE